MWDRLPLFSGLSLYALPCSPSSALQGRVLSKILEKNCLSIYFFYIYDTADFKLYFIDIHISSLGGFDVASKLPQLLFISFACALVELIPICTLLKTALIYTYAFLISNHIVIMIMKISFMIHTRFVVCRFDM